MRSHDHHKGTGDDRVSEEGVAPRLYDAEGKQREPPPLVRDDDGAVDLLESLWDGIPEVPLGEAFLASGLAVDSTSNEEGSPQFVSGDGEVVRHQYNDEKEPDIVHADPSIDRESDQGRSGKVDQCSELHFEPETWPLSLPLDSRPAREVSALFHGFPWCVGLSIDREPRDDEEDSERDEASDEPAPTL